MFIAVKQSLAMNNKKPNQSRVRSNTKARPKSYIVNIHLKYLLLLVVLIVLLVAQLRANEVKPPVSVNENSTSGSNESTTRPDIILLEHDKSRNNDYEGDASFERVRSSSTLQTSLESSGSIDRHDRGNGQPTDSDGSEKSFQQFGADRRRLGSTMPEENDLLLAQPTANNLRVQHAAADESTKELAPLQADLKIRHPPEDPATGANVLAQLEPSLAELTAAGTAAGLMVHEMLTNQANEMPTLDSQTASASDQTGLPSGGPYYMPEMSLEQPIPAASRPELSETDSSIDQEDEQQEPSQSSAPDASQYFANNNNKIYENFSGRNLQQVPLMMNNVGSGATSDRDEDASEGGAADSDEDHHRDALQPSRLVSAGNGMVGRRSFVNQNGIVSGLHSEGVSGAEPAPIDEELMPDSMDSLMRSEGENVDTSGDGAEELDNSQQAAVGTQNSQQFTQNGLAPMNNNLSPGQEAQLSQMAGSGQLDQMAPETDEQSDDEDDGSQAQDTNLQASHHSMPGRLFDSALNDGLDNLPILPSGDAEHSLVAPMRDSLSDLNTAAGHYYGKKGKKKIIVIKKKKKKKKKKYVKKKKVKVIKIVKKKKKKKKKPMKKHLSHSHGHGKYYMYAKVPKKKSWEFGFKKGNKKHWIMRHEKGHKNRFKTKVKWYDKKSKGKGVHIWDYNHHDKKKKKHY